VKEGYRILETYDDTRYPADMSSQEKAFMRITSLVGETGSEVKARRAAQKSSRHGPRA